MPELPNEPDPTVSLPTVRDTSSIPMNAKGELWQYPSPQQMLNAIQRKGYERTNAEDIPAMVAIHNWLNEGSWEEILKWERKYFPYTHRSSRPFDLSAGPTFDLIWSSLAVDQANRLQNHIC